MVEVLLHDGEYVITQDQILAAFKAYEVFCGKSLQPGQLSGPGSPARVEGDLHPTTQPRLNPSSGAVTD